MSRIDGLIAEHCPDGVRFKRLGDVVRIKNGKDHKSLGDGSFPVYGSGGIMRYADAYAYNKPSVLIPRKGSLSNLFFVDVPFWTVDTIFYTEVDEEQIRPKYLYYYLTTVGLGEMNKAGGVPSQTQSVLNELKIPIPCPDNPQKSLEIQAEIVRILDVFSELAAELTIELAAELTTRRKQYSYYRDRLLSFAEGDAEWRPLGDLFPFVRNGFVGTVTPYYTDSESGIRYLQGTNVQKGSINDKNEYYITKEFHDKCARTKLKVDDILVVQSGHVGESAVVGDKYKDCNCHALIVMSNGGGCNSKFINYFLQSAEGKSRLAKITTGGTVKHILASKIKKLEVPVPALSKQLRIVAVLEKFDILINSLSEGLPREIELRQKQYEYYRDLLLSFPRPEGAEA